MLRIGRFPGGTGLEVVVVEILDLQDGFGWLLAARDTCEVAEVLEAFDARRDDDEDVGVVTGNGGEGVGHAGRDDEEVAALGRDDLVAGQDLGGAVEEKEQLSRIGVVVWFRAVGPVGEGDALGGQCAARGAGIGQETHGRGGPADDFGIGGADDHGLGEAGNVQ
jgi:hypothetical protein